MKLKPFSVPIGTSDIVTIREIGPQDQKLLKAGFAHLSDHSRAMRFLAAHPKLTKKELARFTAPNDADHFAIGALIKSEGAPIPVGTARYTRLKRDGELAEFAETITDEYQGKGLGSIMLGVLAKHAAMNGVSTFVGLVHEMNARMRNLLDELQAEALTPSAAETEFRVRLHVDGSRYPHTPVGDAFRTAYDRAQFA